LRLSTVMERGPPQTFRHRLMVEAVVVSGTKAALPERALAAFEKSVD